MFEQHKAEQHAKETQQIYEDVQRVMTERLRNEVKSKLQTQKDKLTQEYRSQFDQERNMMEATLARERQELARTNILNAKLEQRLIELEQLVSVTNENELAKGNQLKVVRGEDGQCKRCEAFVIANGVSLQKLKSVRIENSKLKSKISQQTYSSF